MTVSARVVVPPGRRQPAAGCLAFFFGLFGLVGASLFWALGVRPLVKVQQARSWAECPAKIVSSDVGVHPSSKGAPTYSIDIAYDYFFQGRTYRGTHYDFEIGSSSGRDAKQAVVDRFPAGALTTCFVDPKDPLEAVIDRNIGSWILWGLFPLPFLGVGLGALVFWVAARSAKRRAAAEAATADESGKRALGPA